ncbi:methyltransferase domain-containing protein [Candidatus Curtissbacteria bacterium]|nr:methyltransferase domain-containing protein [Candidatus Curtissbacteria bacterium]
MVDLRKILACPRCQTKLNPGGSKGRCPKCQFAYRYQDGIWELLYITDKETKRSQNQYNHMHQKVFEGPQDGSYEILGRFARGNRTLDIACGDGFIEQFSEETVGLEFSLNALKNAQKLGAKNLVLADSHHLPFIENAFDMVINTGNLEQFANPNLAIKEMARVAKIQILTVHREFDLPFAPLMRLALTHFMGVKNQPIETPLRWSALEKMITNAQLKIIYKGFWTLPVNLGRVFSFLPTFKNIPSCFFVISRK